MNDLQSSVLNAFVTFEKAAGPIWKRVAVRDHKDVIAAMKGKMEDAAKKYMAMVRSAVDLSKLTLGDPDRALSAMADWTEIEGEAKRIYGKVVLEAIQAAGMKLTARQQRSIYKVRVDPIGEATVKWAQKNTARLVTDVTAKTKAGIRAIISDSLDEGRALGATRKMLEGTVGLTERQSQAALKVYEQAYVDGLTEEEALAEMGRYSEQALRYREELIAQTEAAAASSAGLLSAFEENDVQGAEWVADLGPGCCEDCTWLDGQIFSLEDADGMLPAHPGCECAWVAAEMPAGGTEVPAPAEEGA